MYFIWTEESENENAKTTVCGVPVKWLFDVCILNKRWINNKTLMVKTLWEMSYHVGLCDILRYYVTWTEIIVDICSFSIVTLFMHLAHTHSISFYVMKPFNCTFQRLFKHDLYFILTYLLTYCTIANQRTDFVFFCNSQQNTDSDSYLTSFQPYFLWTVVRFQTKMM